MSTGDSLTARGSRLAVAVAVLLGTLGIVLFDASPASAATTVTDLASGATPSQLANSLVGSGVTVSNVAYTGDNTAAGLFSGNSAASSGIGFESGVVLSTGRVKSTSVTTCPKGVEGANACDNNTTSYGKPGDSQLSALAGASAKPAVATAPTHDAAVLTFDFVPSASQVHFSFVFGSEEYDEYVNQQYNDVFAFYVNDKNCALVPNTTTPITVNTINKGSNGQYFRTNLPRPGSIDTEFDGITTVITCVATVTSGATNKMKLAIADTSDGLFDSGVFLKGGSFQTGPPPNTTPTTVPSSGGNTIRGKVVNSAGTAMADAPVQACRTDVNPPQCLAVINSNSSGDYTITGVPSGTYAVSGYSPSNVTNVTPGTVHPLQVSGNTTVTAPNIVLGIVQPPPSDATFVDGNGTNTGKIPLIFWNAPTSIEITGCKGGGTATMTISALDLYTGQTITKTATLTELKDSAGAGTGRYKGTIPPLQPMHGAGRFTFKINGCPDPPEFTGWIDPSGLVLTTTGQPISGATVTLFRSDTPNGTFTQVPSGSAIMSPGNRVNPMLSYADGYFGWDVIAGYYKVRATKSGCTAPNSTQTFVETAVLTIPPPVTDLRLVMQCGSSSTTTTTPGGTTTSTTTTTAVPPGTKAVTRLAGADRILTAVAVSQNAFPTAGSAQAVVLARSETFPDALAGAPLAAKKGGPLLLSPVSTLDANTRTEIKRVLGAGKTVYLLGQAFSASVASALQSDGYAVTVFGGATRFETAVIIADQGLGNPSNIFLATGVNFPDALAGGPAAISVNGAVLLTADAVMHNATKNYLAQRTNTTRYALGGQAASADPSAISIAGVNRYETAVAVAQRFFTSPAAVGLASGTGFADALPAGPHLGKLGGPLLLTDGENLTPGTTSYLQGKKSSVGPAFVYGGTLRVSENAKNRLSQALS